MGGNILLGTLSKFKTLTKFPKGLEGQRESMLPEVLNLSLQLKKKAPVVKLMLLI
ncbi:hypothetical protein C8C85_1476 [Flavobacterium sp. 103]|uniref:hypothetical protein n=1 Tax=Flavobacterium sp. 103 TaxID=2135624 RepID=UPI000D5C6B11|nr:hypothetical protein [Flavobacterium sp. 103]PVX45674.1 hypothetical protein C8C85_1476 [Flavobacterium sp. 103]